MSAVLLGAAGGALLGSRRSLSAAARTAALVSGLALIGAATRAPITDALRRAGTRRRRAAVDLSITLPHPVDAVFGFCRDFENFPQIVGALREVRDYGDGRSHWSASTPTGGTIEWDTVTTKYVPNSVIAWQSILHSPVQMRGLLRFVPEGEATCLRVTTEYQVIDGRLADALVALAMPTRDAELAADIRRIAVYLDGVRSAAPEVEPLAR